MHVDAGYRVRAEGDTLIWHDAADEAICGGLDLWQVRRVELLEVLRAAGLPARLRSRNDINNAITVAMPFIGVTNPCWWAFRRAPMSLRAWAADVSRSAAGVSL